MSARNRQRWLMRQRTTLQLFMVTVLCTRGLETTMVKPSADAGDGQTKDGVASPQLNPLLEAHNASATGDRQRRLIPYMQYYVTSTAAPPGTDNADYQPPSFNQLYNYRPINAPLRETADARPGYYSQKPSKPQQQPIYRGQEEPTAYEYQSQRPPVVHQRKPYYNSSPVKLVPVAGGLKTGLPVSLNPFTYEYNHRHQSSAVKVSDSVGGSGSPPVPSSHGATSYAVVNSASSGDHANQAAAVDLYDSRPKYAVIPREREPYDSVPQRPFAVLPQKVYGIEIHTKSKPHREEGGEDAPAGVKYYLPTVSTEQGPSSRKPVLYQSVPVYKKNRINPFLPTNTIPGPFTPMTSSSSSSSSSNSNTASAGTLQTHQESNHGDQQEPLVQVTYVKTPVSEQPPLDYQSYDHGRPVQDNRPVGEGFPSPYVLVKTVPKYYYEKPRLSASPTPTPMPYQLYYKEKPSDSRKQHSNHSGYTRPRIAGVVPVRVVAAEPYRPAGDEQSINAYYNLGQQQQQQHQQPQLYKVQEQVVPLKTSATLPPRQHLTETILPQQHSQKMVVKELASKPGPAASPYFLGANYKLYKVPAKQQHYVAPEQPYPYPQAQLISTISSTTPKPMFYSSTLPATTSAPAVYEPVYHEQQPQQHHHHHHHHQQQKMPPRHNRTEYANRQRFYPQSMRHPNQHKPRPIPLAPIVEPEREHELPTGGSSAASLSDLLKSLQDTNLLPKTLTPDNIDNSIRTLVKILNNLKQNGHHHRPEEEPPAYGEQSYGRPNYTTAVEPETYVDDDRYHEGPPMLINKIVTPGPNTGKPGIDYPALAEIPETSFKCKDQRYKGFFGDPETNCQVWHYCDLNGGKASFLCPNGTIFSQVALTCDWWFNVKCSTTAQLYVLNERLYKYILPFTPKFPEDYSGPLVDKYLALKFQEMEEKMKQQRAKGAKQGSPIAIPSAVPDNDEVNGNTLEDNDDRYNQNQPYPVKYGTTEAVPDKKVITGGKGASSSAGSPITLEDIDAELQQPGTDTGEPSSMGGSSSSSSTVGPSTMRSSTEVDEDAGGPPTSPANFRASSVPTTTFLITTEDPPNEDYREMILGPEGRGEEDDFSNVLSTEQPAGPAAAPLHLPTVTPVLSKIRRIEVKNDGTSGHLVRNPNYERRRR